MASIDEEFLKDLEQCLKVADKLGEVDTEEARMFVSEQIQDLHKFLQQKQTEAEMRIDKEIKKEEEEIEGLKQRIDRAIRSDGSNEADIAYTDFGLLWGVLKDEYWQLAFNAFLAETKDPVQTIMKNLIDILQSSFEHCYKKATDMQEKMKFQIYHPGEEQTNKNLKLPTDKSVDDFCKKCQINSTPFCLPSVQQEVVSTVKQDKKVKQHFQHKTKELKKSLDMYLGKCLEFCWIACFKEPQIKLVTVPNKECPGISKKFVDLDRTTHSKRKDFAIVEWPAIIQDKEILIEWQLYLLNQPRPSPKNMHGDTGKDYRVTRTEDEHGREVDNPDDNIPPANTGASSGASTSEQSVTVNKREDNNPKDKTGKADNKMAETGNTAPRKTGKKTSENAARKSGDQNTQYSKTEGIKGNKQALSF